MINDINIMEINYLILGVSGGLVGFIRWFYKCTLNEDWSRKRKISEAAISILFGFFMMPGTIKIASKLLIKYNMESPEITIMIGAFAAFFAFELSNTIINFIKKYNK